MLVGFHRSEEKGGVKAESDKRFDFTYIRSEILRAIWAASLPEMACERLAMFANEYAPSSCWKRFVDSDGTIASQEEAWLKWLATMLDAVPKSSNIGLLILDIYELDSFMIELMYGRAPAVSVIPNDDEDDEIDWNGFPRRLCWRSRYLDRIHKMITAEAPPEPFPDSGNAVVIPRAFVDAYVIGMIRLGLDRLPLSLWLGRSDTRSVHLRVGGDFTPVARISRSTWIPIRDEEASR